jgi:hypothetical protein
LFAALLFGASTPLAKLALSSANPLLVAGFSLSGFAIGLAVLHMIFAAAGRRAAKLLSRETIFPGSLGPFSPAAWSPPRFYCRDL